LQIFLEARGEDADKALSIQRQMKSLKKHSRVSVDCARRRARVPTERGRR
jgi:hypothetical protein